MPTAQSHTLKSALKNSKTYKVSERVPLDASQEFETAKSVTEMDRLKHILKEADASLRQQESQIVDQIKNCLFLDRNLVRQPLLRKAKLAVAQILRAIKKDDFMLL